MAKKEIPYEGKPAKSKLNILFGVFFFFALVGLGLTLVLNVRPIYYLAIKMFDIDVTSGYPVDEIKLNFNALMDYCCPFFTGPLQFPTMPSSASATSHFAEVKVIFNIIYAVGFVSFLVITPVFIYKLYYREKNFFKTCAITTIVIPIILLLACIIDFDDLFILFHKVVFSNDDWLFNPATDPIIKILPESYFMLCAIIIAAIVIIGAIVAFIIYLKIGKTRKDNDDTLIPRKKNYIY